MADRTQFELINDGDYLGSGYYNDIFNKIDLMNDISFSKNPTQRPVTGSDIYVGAVAPDAWLSQTEMLRVVNNGDGSWDVDITEDIGATWTQVISVTFAPTIRVNTSDRNCFVIMDGETLKFFSDDRGDSYTYITQDYADGYTVGQQADITNEGRIYSIGFATGEVPGIHYSDDWGVTWTEVTGHGISSDYADCIIRTAVNGLIAFTCADSSDDEGSAGITYNDGTSWSKINTSGGRCSEYLHYFYYYDSDNYMISLECRKELSANDADGVHAIRWNGTTISSSSSIPWLEGNEDYYHKFFIFSKDHFIYMYGDQDGTYDDSISSLYSYSLLLGGDLIVTNTAWFGRPDSQYPLDFIGIGIDGEDILASGTTLYQKM